MKPLAAVAGAMVVVLVVGVLVASDAVDLPGNWGERLGLREATANPPCRPGLYWRSPKSPPQPQGRWRLEPESPKAPVEGSAVAIGPTIYMAGGSKPGNLRTLLAFDTRRRRWSEPGQLPVGLNHSQAVTYKGDLYLAGGFLEGLGETDALWRYDPQSGRWSELAPMATPRGGAASAVIGGRLYVVDGGSQPYNVEDPRPPLALLEIYDFETDSWTTGPEPPVAVHHVNAAALDGKLYIAGGRVDHEKSIDAFLRYDPRTERWQRLADLPMGALASLGVVAAGGRILVLAGDDEVDWEDGGGWVSQSAWAYDPRSGRWLRLPDLNVGRHAFGAAVANGRVYAIAGSICPGLKPNGPVGTHVVESLPIPTG